MTVFDPKRRVKKQRKKGSLRDGGEDPKIVFDKFDSKSWSGRSTLSNLMTRWF